MRRAQACFSNDLRALGLGPLLRLHRFVRLLLLVVFGFLRRRERMGYAPSRSATNSERMSRMRREVRFLCDGAKSIVTRAKAVVTSDLFWLETLLMS